MANRSTDMKSGEETIIRGTGNVFADLGFTDADERQTKLRLALSVNRVIARRKLTQAAAAAKLGQSAKNIGAGPGRWGGLPWLRRDSMTDVKDSTNQI